MSNVLTHKLWLTQLKRQIPDTLRMDALRLLYHLSSQALNRQISLQDVRSIVRQEVADDLLSFLVSAGVIEEGFTSIRLIDDDPFIDLIEKLYKMEVLRGSQNKIVDRDRKRELVEEGFLEIKVPSTECPGHLVIRMLEEVAKTYGISPDIIGKLQAVIADAMNTLPFQKGCCIGFKMENDDFLIKIDIPSEISIINDDASLRLIKGVDDIRIEQLPGLSRLILSKKIYKSSLSSLQ